MAALTPVIGAAYARVAHAISTIFLFNIAAAVSFPLIGHLLGMDPEAFGLFAGTAVNDMSSAVAVATAYGPAAVDDAVVVKLTRTLMIIALCLGLAVLAGPIRTTPSRLGSCTPALAQRERPHPDVMAAQRRERARVRREKGVLGGGRSLQTAGRPTRAVELDRCRRRWITSRFVPAKSDLSELMGGCWGAYADGGRRRSVDPDTPPGAE